MRIDLEVVPGHFRSERPIECYPCGRRFVVGTDLAIAFSDEGTVVYGEEVCPKCLEAGPDEMRANLECRAQLLRLEAAEDEMIAAGDITAPRIEDLKVMEEIAAL